MNRCSNGRVMAPGSWGAEAVFALFSGEDSSQTGKAIGEPRVARRSWSRHISNAPEPAHQLEASRKDSVREGGCPVEKTCFTPSAFFLKSCPSSRAQFLFLILPDFQGPFWRSSGTQNGSCSISLESPRCLLSKDIKFARIGVWRKSYGFRKSGRLSCFFAFFRR